MPRYSTGIGELDAHLGGGLLPGTLTVVMGATGIGKTQFGLQFAQAGAAQEGHRGVLFDMTSRGDSQSHAEYARRMFGWELTAAQPQQHVELNDVLRPGSPSRGLSARLRLPGAPRHAPRPGVRDVPPVAGGAECPAGSLDRVLLRQLCARRAALRDRRRRADRPAERLHPVRPVRVHLSADPQEGTRVGRPRPVPAALSGQAPRRSPSIRTMKSSSPACCSTRRTRRCWTI